MKNEYNLAWGGDMNQDDRQLRELMPASEADFIGMSSPNDLVMTVTDEMKTWVRELKVIKSEMKTLEEREKFLKGQITSHMLDAQAVVDSDGVEVVTWKTSVVRRFNQSRFKQEQPELISEYTDTFDVKRFVIK